MVVLGLSTTTMIEYTAGGQIGDQIGDQIKTNLFNWNSDIVAK